MNILNEKIKTRLKLFDNIDNIFSNEEANSNFFDSININKKDNNNIEKSKEIKNKIIYDFDSMRNTSLYPSKNFSIMTNYLRAFKKRIKNNNSQNRSKNKEINSSKSNYNKNNSFLNQKGRLFQYEKNQKSQEKNIEKFKKLSVPKIDKNKKVVKDPQKFVEKLFYNKDKENIDINGNFTYRPKINKKSKEIIEKMGSCSIALHKTNKKIDKNLIEKITIESYNNLFRKNASKLKNKNNKSYSNLFNHLDDTSNSRSILYNYNNESNLNHLKHKKKMNIMHSLYDRGMEDLKRKEIIYQENIIRRNDEYKKFPYRPNAFNTCRLYNKKGLHRNNSSLDCASISLEQLNDDMYSKQVEWKNRKDNFNAKRKKFEEDLYISQNCTFRPDISHEYIKDDEKMIKRNLRDINNYILKRRKMILNKKDKAFTLRNYKDNRNKSSIKYFNRNGNYLNKVKYPNTAKVFFNEGIEISNISNVSSGFNLLKMNNSQYNFIEAVKALHNEIQNLNI